MKIYITYKLLKELVRVITFNGEIGCWCGVRPMGDVNIDLYIDKKL